LASKPKFLVLVLALSLALSLALALSLSLALALALALPLKPKALALNVMALLTSLVTARAVSSPGRQSLQGVKMSEKLLELRFE